MVVRVTKHCKCSSCLWIVKFILCPFYHSKKETLGFLDHCLDNKPYACLVLKWNYHPASCSHYTQSFSFLTLVAWNHVDLWDWVLPCPTKLLALFSVSSPAPSSFPGIYQPFHNCLSDGWVNSLPGDGVCHFHMFLFTIFCLLALCCRRRCRTERLWLGTGFMMLFSGNRLRLESSGVVSDPLITAAQIHIPLIWGGGVKHQAFKRAPRCTNAHDSWELLLRSLLQVWSQDEKHQHHIRAFEKSRVSSPGIRKCLLTKAPGKSFPY
jgi:hypothetical protein